MNQRNQPSNEQPNGNGISLFLSSCKQLLEKADREPTEWLSEIFQLAPLPELNHQLKAWANIALANPRSIYDEPHEREELLLFVTQLRMFLSSLHDVQQATRPPATAVTEQMNNTPRQIISFFQHYSLPYIQKELWTLLDAVITYEGQLLEGINKHKLLFYYQCIICLVEAGSMQEKLSS